MGCIIYFFLIVTFFSVSEVAMLLYVAQQTSLLFTMACCVFTGIVGGFFVRQQGLLTLAKIKKTLEQGAIPADEAIEGLLLLIVGILLCVPGFITDFLGFLIIIPPIRAMVARVLVDRFKAGLATGQFKVYTPGNMSSDQPFSGQKKSSAENEIENATIIEVKETDEEKQDREG
ncbi:MAG: protein FxsA [Clostridiales bacterium]|jgi:UPF0716 protein FxsA|nr:protein FxsA [Clostridiales bacterium]MDN5283008.1 protein FxsA [Candidatus Ozemobacter sp.]